MDLESLLDRHDTGSGLFDRATVRVIVGELLLAAGRSLLPTEQSGAAVATATKLRPRVVRTTAAPAPAPAPAATDASTTPTPASSTAPPTPAAPPVAAAPAMQPDAAKTRKRATFRSDTTADQSSARDDLRADGAAADQSPRRQPLPSPSPAWRSANHISVMQLDTVSSRDPRDNSSFILYGFDVRIFGKSIHHIRTRYSKARHFHDVLDSEGLLKHFKPSLDFPGRHVFWDNVKDPDSITVRWEEMRCYYERLLNQPEALACPLLYDELGLSEATLLNACLQPSASPASPIQRSRQSRARGTEE